MNNPIMGRYNGAVIGAGRVRFIIGIAERMLGGSLVGFKISVVIGSVSIIESRKDLREPWRWLPLGHRRVGASGTRPAVDGHSEGLMSLGLQ